MQNESLNFSIQGEPEEIGAAVFCNLRATAHAMYTAMVAIRVAAAGGMIPSPASQVALVESAFDSVIALLPKNSPFVFPLEQTKVASVKEVAAAPVTGDIFVPSEPGKLTGKKP